jgi:adenylate cyclase class 2
MIKKRKVKRLPMEVEAKAYAENLKAIEKMLIEQDARFLGKVRQKDTYFNHPQKDFEKTDEALRIREVEGNTFFTYKGPKIDSITKTREEIEIEVEDPGKAREFLLKLGFKEVREVIKTRSRYQFDDFVVCLDEVADLGKFVEIESSCDEHDHDRVNELRESILETLRSWNLTKIERKSYLELLFEKDK